jgi:uncharacterized membrane protein (GlpM family)
MNKKKKFKLKKTIKVGLGALFSYFMFYGLFQTLNMMSTLSATVVTKIVDWQLTQDTYIIVAIQMIQILLVVVVIFAYSLAFWIKKTVKAFMEKKK